MECDRETKRVGDTIWVDMNFGSEVKDNPTICTPTKNCATQAKVLVADHPVSYHVFIWKGKELVISIIDIHSVTIDPAVTSVVKRL